MTERNGADVVREYMASPNNPMRVLIQKWREGVERRRMYFGDDTAKKLYSRHADELEAALADTGELVSRIDYLVETEIAALRDARGALQQCANWNRIHGKFSYALEQVVETALEESQP